MLNFIGKRVLPWFFRKFDYNGQYLLDIAEYAPGLFSRYLLSAPLSQYRKVAPLEPYWIAKLVATRRFDCGPCLRLVFNMAKAENVDERLLTAVLACGADLDPDARFASGSDARLASGSDARLASGSDARLASGSDARLASGSDARLAYDLANAVVDQDAPRVAELNERALARWGKAATAEIALGIAFGAFYPTWKRGMGAASHCEPVVNELLEPVANSGVT